MEDAIRLDGRVLFLSQDPAVIAAQLAGQDFTSATAGPLRDNVSTDEITPVTVMLTYDERLGQFPYVGFKAGEVLPIGRDAVKNGGFRVTVAGKRYGKGSSRESSPLAELSAGIRLIVAESFERIYQQNCDNIGILTTTDLSVLDRLIAGEAVPIDEFLKGRDALTQQIIRSGGLLAYSKFADWPAPQVREAADTSRIRHQPPSPHRSPEPSSRKSSSDICIRASPARSAAMACLSPRTGALATTISPGCAPT
jgi:3-isopropylmalate/(R)-2-methylmalate dehydratase large subunit